jgi:nucleoside-diphosphate-sugar epimerase
VSVLNRGRTALRPVPAEASRLVADVTDPAAVDAALGDRRFDAVVDFLTFSAADADRAIDVFGPRTDQYVYVSTASLYDRSGGRLPLVESSPRVRTSSDYTMLKLAAEDRMLAAFAGGFPTTVVRPSHTYDDAKPPLPGGWTEVHRLLRGAPVIVPGDGTSLWTVTHSEDLAVGLVGLLGDPRTVGEIFHITSDEVLPWDEIYRVLARAAGVTPRLVHLPAEWLTLGAPDWRWAALIAGDLRYSTIADNTKVRRFVPSFRPRITWPEGARRALRWFGEHQADVPADPHVDAVLDRLASGADRAAELFRSLAP